MILLLDNHDSFVHNLARYFRLAGEATRVIRSDAIDVDVVRQLSPLAIVLSPGPKGPQDAGCCVDVVRELSASIPIMGVCLGHQSIGYALGGEVIRVEPMHGRESEIVHDGSVWFDGIPPTLRIAAETRVSHGEEPVVMAIRHLSRPLIGFQFHPESVLTPAGSKLVENFIRQARAWHQLGPESLVQPHDQVQPVA
jgi:anthranilate synthase/aminodeoxychorismate synthase-like glutamine amidotransferase